MSKLVQWAGFPISVLLVVRLFLGGLYALSTPAWEAYDEDGHFAYIRYLAVNRTLLQPNDPEAERVWEKFQPPLYYLLMAPLVLGLDLGPTLQLPEVNPYFVAGNAGFNKTLHPAQEPVPVNMEDGLLRVRLAGVVLSTLSVALVYSAVRKIWPHDPNLVWASTALYAFWPQFLFVGSMATNDLLVTVWASGVFYLVVTLTLEPFRRRWVMALGGVLGLSLLTKLNGFAFFPAALGAVGLSLMFNAKQALPWRSPRFWLMGLGLGLLVLAALGALNSMTFVTAQVFQIRTLYEFINQITTLNPAEQNTVGQILRYGFNTFLASFGWGNLNGFAWLYPVWGGAVGLAAAGWLLSGVGGWVTRLAMFRHWAALDAPRYRLFALLVVQVVSLVGLALALAITHQDRYLLPGRYLLPSLAAVSCLLVQGWRALIPPRWGQWFWPTLSLGLVGVSGLIPVMILRPAYAAPVPLTTPIAHPLSFFYGEAIELLGYQSPEAVRLGEELKLPICWRAVAPLTVNYTVELDVIGPDGQGYGRLETYPGRGNYPTSRWHVNEPFCDTYRVVLRGDFPAPAVAQVALKLFDHTTGEALPVRDAHQALLADLVVFIPIKITAREVVSATPVQPVRYIFGDGIELTGYTLYPQADQVRLSLRWEARARPAASYTVFVHFRDTPTTAYLHGEDLPPRRGAYPTDWWDPGEVIWDEHLLTLPVESAQPPPLDLYVGLYTNDKRLAVTDAQGNQMPNSEVLLERGVRLFGP